MKQANFNSNPPNLTHDSFKIETGIIMLAGLKRAYTGLQGHIRAYEEISTNQDPLNHNHHLAAS